MTDNTELLKDLLLAKCAFQLKAIESVLMGQCAAIHTSVKGGEIVVREISYDELYVSRGDETSHSLTDEGIEQ